MVYAPDQRANRRNRRHLRLIRRCLPWRMTRGRAVIEAETERVHAPEARGGRVVVVSNRVALPRDLKPGGLALAMRLALRERGGVWLGWSGKIGARAHEESVDGVTFATLDLSAREYEE